MFLLFSLWIIDVAINSDLITPNMFNEQNHIALPQCEQLIDDLDCLCSFRDIKLLKKKKSFCIAKCPKASGTCSLYRNAIKFARNHEAGSTIWMPINILLLYVPELLTVYLTIYRSKHETFHRFLVDNFPCLNFVRPKQSISSRK